VKFPSNDGAGDKGKIRNFETVQDLTKSRRNINIKRPRMGTLRSRDHYTIFRKESHSRLRKESGSFIDKKQVGSGQNVFSEVMIKWYLGARRRGGAPSPREKRPRRKRTLQPAKAEANCVLVNAIGRRP